MSARSSKLSNIYSSIRLLPLPTLPNRLPSEWYLSYVYRLHLMAALPALAGSVEKIFGKRLILSHFAPTGLTELLGRIPQSTGLSEEVILAENTIFPYLKTFAFEHSALEFKKKYLLDQISVPRYSAAAALRSGLTKREPRFCVACLQEDFEHWGMPYFHREHQIPEVTVCVRHGKALRTCCVECGPLPWPPYGVWLAGRCRKCDADLSTQVQHPSLVYANPIADLRIAQIITQFLDANLPLLDVSVLRATYRRALERNDLISHRNDLSGRKLARAVAERFGEKYMREIGMPPENQTAATPRWVTSVLGGSPSVRPLEHCVIIFFLFGSFDNFISEYSAMAPKEKIHDDFFSRLRQYSAYKVTTIAWARSREIPLPYIERKLDQRLEFGELPSFKELFLAGLSKRKISIITGQPVGRVNKFIKDNPDLECIRAELNYKKKFDAHKKRLEEFFVNNPKGTLVQYRRYRGTLDDWLERNEASWLEERFRAQEKIRVVPEDEKYEAILRKYIQDEYAAENCERISIGRVRLALSLSGMMKRPNSEFPLFWRMLNMYAETPDQFIARRVKSAFLRGISYQYFTVSTLLNFAGISPKHRRKQIAIMIAEDLLTGGDGAAHLRIGPMTPM
jgi:hypothetical protein